MPLLNILVITDLHYRGVAAGPGSVAPRRGEWMPLFVKRALNRLQQRNEKPDLILLLGDILDNGGTEGSDAAWLQLAGGLHATGIPVLAVAGNHDVVPEKVAQWFNSAPGLHRIGGYGFLVFNDRQLGGDHFIRDAAELALPQEVAAANPNLPLIALQHNPVYPPIESEYPYCPDNAAEIIDSYREAGVVFSLSGHYHRGMGPHELDGTTYLTAPALADAPFSFLRLTLEGGKMEVERHTLAHDIPRIGDVHCHSEFAYCATDITTAQNIEIAKLLGMHHLCITEHAFHLYFSREDSWGAKWVREPSLVAQAWAKPGRGRMEKYRAFAESVRSDFVKIGLELDLYGDGELLLAPEDRNDWDILLGAVHFINGVTRGETTQEEVERLFMRDVEALLTKPIQVLAHPFRFFAWSGYTKPEHLYEAVAERLAAAGVAAEINFHGNQPEPEFFRACLTRNVKIAFGSDSHCMMEPADFDRNIRFMRDLGVSDSELPGVLFQP